MSKFWDIFRPSKWLKRFLTKVAEKAADRFYEGPKPPKRLRERVQMFRLHYPNATSEQWAQFALQFGTNCYREGFTRGNEYAERGWDGPMIEPEQAAEIAANDWSLAEENPDWGRMLKMGYDPRDPLAGVSAEQRRAIVETMMGAGSFPVEVDLSAYEGRPIGNGNPGFREQEEVDDERD